MKQGRRRRKKSKPTPSKEGGEKNCGGGERENSVVMGLMEAFESVTLEEARAAYKEAYGDPNKAAEILVNLAKEEEMAENTTCFSNGSSEDGTTRSSVCSAGSSGSNDDGMTNSSTVSSAGSTGSGSLRIGHCGVGEKGFRGRGKTGKVIAVSGTVSTVLGKDYVSANPKREMPKSNGYENENAAQFLYSMLGDECELSMDVVRDVFYQCGHDIEKALKVLLELSASSNDLSKGHSSNFWGNMKEDTPSESSEVLTDRASDSTSHSSESEFQDTSWSVGCNTRNYIEALVGSGPCKSPRPRNLSELPQEVLETLFHTSRSSEHEPNNMNWRNVVKKMESLGQKLELTPKISEQQAAHAKGDEYQVFRKTAGQQWDAMKSYYQKAATAYANGKQDYAAYLSEQGQLCNKKARKADERASQFIFQSRLVILLPILDCFTYLFICRLISHYEDYRNKNIENMITIDLHGQHVKQAMRLLKLHLLFGAIVRSVQLFRVITGCGSRGLGKSKVKEAVVHLIDKEGIEWTEENRGTLLIKLDGQTEFGFLDADSDTE